MSMDFVYDLKEKLDKQDMEYAICIMKPTKKQDVKVELFYNVQNDESFEALCEAFQIICGAEPGDNVKIEHDSDEEK